MSLLWSSLLELPFKLFKDREAYEKKLQKTIFSLHASYITWRWPGQKDWRAHYSTHANSSRGCNIVIFHLQYLFHFANKKKIMTKLDLTLQMLAQQRNCLKKVNKSMTLCTHNFNVMKTSTLWNCGYIWANELLRSI